jgi:hypothetical protein
MTNPKTETVLAEADWNEGDGVSHLDVVHVATTHPNGIYNSIRFRALVSHFGAGIRVELPTMDRRILRWLIKSLQDAESRLGPKDSWTHNSPKFILGNAPYDG